MEYRLGLGVLTRCVVVLLAMPLCAHADSIKVDGKTYDNVYIRSTGANYYVQLPDTGGHFNVRKSEVAPGAVYINPNKKFRAELKARWEKAAAKDMPAAVLPRVAVIRPQARKTRTTKGAVQQFRKGDIAAIDTGSGVPLLTGRLEHYMERRKARPIFVDENGVTLFTSFPEIYHGDLKYLEIQITYEAIVIPEELKKYEHADHYTPKAFREIVAHYCKQYDLDEPLVYAVIRQESNFNERAQSPAGAQGLMQLMPGTASDMNVSNSFDPVQNIAGGTQYLRKMLDYFNQDIRLALAGYNAGPGNVRKYGNTIPPFKETQNYVVSVLRYRDEYGRTGVIEEVLAKAQIDSELNLPQSASTQDPKAKYTLHYRNGLTQPADTVIVPQGKSQYYYVEFRNVTTQVPKKYIKAITEAV